MPANALHQIHKRKGKKVKKKWVKNFDQLLLIVGIVTPLMALPQIYKIWFEKIVNDIGFELKRTKQQAELLFNNSGSIKKELLNDVVYKYYAKVPKNLRAANKIKTSRWLNDDQKKELIER